MFLKVGHGYDQHGQLYGQVLSGHPIPGVHERSVPSPLTAYEPFYPPPTPVSYDQNYAATKGKHRGKKGKRPSKNKG